MQYYVYQCDMVQGVEDLRTPLHEIIKLDKEIRGTLSGFMMPSFVVDLPGGGGKRLVSTFDSYENGVAKYTAPGLGGKKAKKEYKYYDPQHIPSEAWAALRDHKAEALRNGQTLEQVARARHPGAVSDAPSDQVPMPAISQGVGGRKSSQEPMHWGVIPRTQPSQPQMATSY